jgi:hypothetical protein
MKKKYSLLILSCLILMLCSCGVKNDKNKLTSQQEMNIRKDSLNQLKIDSIQKMKIDSLAQYAWGDSKFGMSTTNAKNTSTFKKGTLYSYKSDPSSSIRLNYTATDLTGIDFIEASFFNDRLFRVDLETSYKSANFYDTEIKATTLKLKNLVEEKYGKPERDNGFPDFLDMKPDRSITAYSWVIGDKHIYIAVDEKPGGSEYRTTCVIISDKESEPVAIYNEKIRNDQKVKEKNGF